MNEQHPFWHLFIPLYYTHRLAFTHWLHSSSYSAKESLIRDITNALLLAFKKILLGYLLVCCYNVRCETEDSPCIEDLTQLGTGVSPNKRLSLQCKLVLVFNIKNTYFFSPGLWRKRKRKHRGNEEVEWQLNTRNEIFFSLILLQIMQ